MRHLVLIDTNLLVLLVVGTASEDFVERHKRTKAYTGEDYRLLRSLLLDADGLLFTPNVLTETSNLIRQFAEPGKQHVLNVFRDFIEQIEEVVVKSLDAAKRAEFRYLGLTDVALLSIDRTDVTLLTDDFDLYQASLSAGQAPINFSHQREIWLGL
jgi:hypothetical protein